MNIKDDNWKRRWLMIRLCTLAITLMGIGLFLITPEHASAIGGPIMAICGSLSAIVMGYSGIAAADDHSARKFSKGG